MQKIIRDIFIGLDNVIYSTVMDVYDLLLTIARTSILSQAQITTFANRIYELLAIFMVFKVTLSLITYVVNPDSFTEKSQGIGPLIRNIIISLSLLVLTPYIFNMAFEAQTYLLEGNTIPKLIFGLESETSDTINSAGEVMAFTAMNAFVSPNTAIKELEECIDMYDETTDGYTKVKDACLGITTNPDTGFPDADTKTDDDEETDDEQVADGGIAKVSTVEIASNYAAGIASQNYYLTFRADLLTTKATGSEDSPKEFVMTYHYFISTIVGFVILLLLINFCMDIAVRSIKLSFYQLIAPIPIISYIDPKSGKDGLFKKWYKACFSTYLSLFIRLFVIYFGIYLIDLVADAHIYDVVTGQKVGGFLLKVFMIIGILIFVKQMPKILENLGIKIDGGAFTLNPLKKIGNEALGGKRFTGTLGGIAGGAIAGAIGGSHGKTTAERLKTGLAAAGGGAVRGGLHGKGFRAGIDVQSNANRKLREGRMLGLNKWQSTGYAFASRFGGEKMLLEERGTDLNERRNIYDKKMEEIEGKVSGYKLDKYRLNNTRNNIENGINNNRQIIKETEAVQSAADSVLNFADKEVNKNKGGITSVKRGKYAAELQLLNKGGVAATPFSYHYLDENGKVQEATVQAGQAITETDIQRSNAFQGWYSKTSKLEYADVLIEGTRGRQPKLNSSHDDYLRDSNGNVIYFDMTDDEKEAWNEKHADFIEEWSSYNATTAASTGVLATELGADKDTVDAAAIVFNAAALDKQSSAMANIAKHHTTEIMAKEKMIESIKRQAAQIDENISDVENNTMITLPDGTTMSIAEYKANLDRDQNAFDRDLKIVERSVDFGNAGHFIQPHQGGGK